MKNVLKVEMKRVFKSKAFYISILIGIGLSLWVLISQLNEVKELNETIKEYGTEKLGLYYPRNLYNSFIGLDYVYVPSTILYVIIPLLVTMPYGMSYYKDKKSGYIKNVFIKCDRKQYYLSKYIAVFFSGVIVTMVILVFSLFLSAMFFPALMPESVTDQVLPFASGPMLSGLFYTHPMCYVAIYIMIDSIFMGAIATLALGISIIAKNILLVFAGGMLLYVGTDYAMGLVNSFQYSPYSFLRPTQIKCNASPIIILCEGLFLIVIVALPFLTKEKKKDVF